MLKNIIWTLLFLFSSTGKIIKIPELPKISNFKLNKLKTVKHIKRGITIGGSVGASVPIVNEVVSLNNQINIAKYKFQNLENHVDMSNPSKYIMKYQITGESWSYYKMLNSIINNDIIGVAIHQDGKYAFIIEKVKQTPLSSDNIHRVTTIPNHINELIDKLLQYNIDFDVFT